VASTRSELPKNDARIHETTSLDVFARVPQSLVESSPILFGEPISRVEVQELDFRALWQIGRFVNDKPSGPHSSFQRHVTTVAPAPFGNKMRSFAS
jgi:hypothetical protein